MQNYSHPDLFFCPLYNRPGISDPKMNLCGSEDDWETSQDSELYWASSPPSSTSSPCSSSPTSPSSSTVRPRPSRYRVSPSPSANIRHGSLFPHTGVVSEFIPEHVSEQLAVPWIGRDTGEEGAQVQAHERQSGQVAPRLRDGSREPADRPHETAAGEHSPYSSLHF